MNSNYIRSSSQVSPRKANSIRMLVMLALAFMFTSFAVVGMVTPTASADEDNKALWEKLVCKFDEDSWPRIAYQLSQTSDDEFYLYSKSTLGVSTSSIDNPLNDILDFVTTENGKYPELSFVKRNEKILGLKATKEDPDPFKSGIEPEEGKLNSGQEINFFERFGLAGMTFSNYGGEWRHFWIDACKGTVSNYEPAITSVGGGSTGDGSALILDNNAAAVHGFRPETSMPKLIASTPEPADFITLQEAVGPNWRAEKIKAASPGYEVIAGEPCVNGTEDPNQKCLAILYKSEYSVVASGDTTLTSGKERYGGQAKPTWERHAFWATFSSGITVVNVHLPTAGNYVAYKDAINNLVPLLETFPGSVVVSGDFNPGTSGPQSTEMERRTGPLGYQKAKITAHPNYFYYNTNNTSIINEGARIPKEGLTDHGNGAHWTTFSHNDATGAPATGTGSVHLGNLNILGDGHTDGPNANKPDFPTWSTRLDGAFALFESSGTSIVTLQEVHSRQEAAINSNAKYAKWEQFPERNSQNKVIWDTSQWSMVEGRTPKYSYSGGKAVMPVVRLSSTTTGEELYVMSIHNPANVQKGNSGNRSENTRQQLALMQELAATGVPVVIAGDFNDGGDGQQASHCILTPTMTNAFGPGSLSPCKKPAGSAPIDHIYGINTGFSAATVDTSTQAQKISDHPFVHTMIGSGSGTSGSNLTSNLPDGGHGQFYDTRLIPRSTWADIDKSLDPRTRQFSSGLNSRFGFALLTNLCNWLFAITKFIFVFTFAIVGLSFADVSSMIGLQEVITGQDPACTNKVKAGCADLISNSSGGGIVGNLFDNLFVALITMAFAMTALYMLWHGIVKRQYRNALGGLFQALACFFIGMIIFLKPVMFMSLPNDVAVVGQALTASALGYNAEGKEDKLCATDVGGKLVKGNGGTDAEASYNIVEEASVKFRAQLGCRWWKALVLRPWLQAQYKEDDWRQLNGEAYAEAGNRNTPYGDNTGDDESKGWVGKPEVPRGDGKTYENWALFQISTQTDVHYPVGYEDSLEQGDYTQGVHTDWWRVVDAVSNYQEEINTDGSGPSGSGGTTIEFSGPLTPRVMDQWDNWTGTDQSYRYGVVLSSILVAFVAVLAPLAVAMTAVMYAIGVAILMAFSPLFFLLGCWAGRGQAIFRGWLSLVINLTIKRIILGVILVFTVVVTTNIIDMMNEIGYFQSVLLMLVISIVIIRSRKKILDAFANVQLSAVNLGNTAGRIPGIVKTGGSKSLRMGAVTAMGGAASRARGGSFAGGALAGLKSEVNDLTYRNRSLGNIRVTYDELKRQKDGTQGLVEEGDYCPVCGQPFLPGQPLAESKTFGYVHQSDVDTYLVTDEDVVNENVGYATPADRNESTARLDESIYKNNKIIETSKLLDDDMAGNVEKVTELAKHANDEIERYNQAKIINKRVGRPTAVPMIPDEINPYVDSSTWNNAWKNGDEDFIRLAVTHGWIEWAKNENDTFAANLDKEQAVAIYVDVMNYESSNWRSSKEKPDGSLLRDSDRTNNQS